MNDTGAAELVRRQRAFFATGQTRDVAFRQRQLEILEEAIISREESILGALRADLGRPAFESYASEIHTVLSELRHARKHLDSWVRPRKASVSLVHFWSSGRVISEPLGVVLIIAPWNYPFQLVMAPLVGAIAAGDCAMVKPSEISPSTSSLIAELIRDSFNPAYIATYEGGKEQTQELLAQKMDHIFFTGGAAVGRIIMQAAAEQLTPVTLELGGKSPCIVEDDGHLDYTTRRIAWGKFFNAGQSCVAPDYVLVKQPLEQRFLQSLSRCLRDFYGNDPHQSGSYGRIVNSRHFRRLVALLDDGRVVFGGDHDETDLYIGPTLMTDVSLDSTLMKDEIFGPILPVIPYSTISEAVDFVNDRPKPLSLYLFANDEDLQERVLRETTSGGVCINDTVIHLDSQDLPFGGVGQSGMGNYHGKASFDTFSHTRSVLKRSLRIDPPLRYPPFERKMGLMKRLLGKL